MGFCDEQLHLLTSHGCLYIQTYHSRYIPEGVAEVSQIYLRDTHVLPKLVSYEEHCMAVYIIYYQDNYNKCTIYVCLSVIVRSSAVSAIAEAKQRSAQAMVSHGMGDQNLIISSSSVLRKAR
jgi:hypothetical protein